MRPRDGGGAGGTLPGSRSAGLVRVMPLKEALAPDTRTPVRARLLGAAEQRFLSSWAPLKCLLFLHAGILPGLEPSATERRGPKRQTWPDTPPHSWSQWLRYRPGKYYLEQDPAPRGGASAVM